MLASRIGFEEDIARMMPNSEATAQINDILSNSSLVNKIVVKIKSPTATPEELIAVADSFRLLLEQHSSKQIREIKSRIDDETALDVYSIVHNNLPVYLDESDYAKIDSLISKEKIAQQLAENYNTLTSATGFVMKKIIADDPLGVSLIAMRKLQRLQVDENFELYDGYMFSDKQQSIFLFITPANPTNETSQNALLIDGLKKTLNSLKVNEANAKIFYYGGSAVAVSNATQLKRDTLITLSFTVVSVLAFITFFFRKKRMPFVMMLPVLFGGLFSMAVIYLLKGSISSIAVAAGSIILGIAVNYSLHFFNHYKHCRNIKQTIADLIVPMTLGSFTTVASFFALTFLQSHILNDFGLFASLSLLGAAAFTLIYLPHFAPSFDSNQYENIVERKIVSSSNSAFKYQWVVVLIIVALTFYFLKHASNVSFESDMASLNFMNPELKESEKEIAWMQNDTSKTVFIASIGKSKQDALQNNELLTAVLQKAEQKGDVKKFGSLTTFLPSQKMQQERIERWNKYWTNQKKKELIANLVAEGTKLKFNPSAFTNISATLNKEYHNVPLDDEQLLQTTLGAEYFLETPSLKAIVNAVTVDKLQRAKLYAELHKLPNVVVLDKQVVTNQFIQIIYSDFNAILTYTFLIVFFALFFSYGRLELTIVTFLPMLISWIWILGIMSLLGLHFNIINIIISTFIFGLGDDFSIFITDGLTQKFKSGKPVLASHKVAIFLCTVTTLLGLGALIFAKHPALRSIALISIIGIFCVVFIGQTLQPFLYNFFIQSRKEKGLAPWTLPTLLLSIFAFSYYVFGSLMLTIFGYILIYLAPYPSQKKRKRLFHFLVCNCLKSLSYIMMNVKKVHINKESMDFSKPAIIISNHISFLDILVTVMQHPKLILLTNHWVYYSPVFGKVVQLADYYPVMEGVDPAIDEFVDIVNDGYSIVVFPEGTRSIDGRTKRFHKGAFYLAEKLNIDIVPLVLHGTGDTMKKGDFMLFNGQKTMKYLPRITLDDISYGNGYAERTKNISKYFKEQYELLREQIETPRYHRQRLRMNYIYKGPELELLALKERVNENLYGVINSIVTRTGTVSVLGCGYGFSAYALHFTGWNRTIVGLDSDEEKIDIANNCYSKNEQLTFKVDSNIASAILPSDAFIIDTKQILLSKDDMQSLLKKCFVKLNEGGKVIFIGSKNGIEEFNFTDIYESAYLVTLR
jgi:1-acyl-sn-glycerol-3-phosphate acyltransferase